MAHNSPRRECSQRDVCSVKKTTLQDMQCTSLKAIGILLIVVGFISLFYDSFALSMIIVVTGLSISIAPLFGFRLKKADREEIPLIVLLLRHGESTANVDPSVYESTPDHAIPLSERGQKMTDAAGCAIAKYLADRLGCPASPDLKHHKKFKCKLLVSPFRRTRETASLLLKTDLAAWITDVEESSLLVEQDWGMFEGTGLVKGKILYEKEYEHLQTQKLHRGKFWARMPLGESAFDVCQRVVSLFGSIQQGRSNAAEDGAEAQVVIVVSHGITSRAFTMMWCHYSPEWFDSSYNFPNCAVRILDSAIPGWDGGGLFGGFDSKGEMAPCQPVLADPVQTRTNELYYKFCTETRYHPIRRSSKHSTMIRRASTDSLTVNCVKNVVISDIKTVKSAVQIDTKCDVKIDSKVGIVNGMVPNGLCHNANIGRNSICNDSIGHNNSIGHNTGAGNNDGINRNNCHDSIGSNGVGLTNRHRKTSIDLSKVTEEHHSGD